MKFFKKLGIISKISGNTFINKPGYKLQFARSKGGFIGSCLTPKGNAADSEMPVPVVKQCH
ncbi:MAG: hypothetical protein K9M56_08965 [Victivallales bacterium]|nr:hypothetical protein [Victivallales bacterium]